MSGTVIIYQHGMLCHDPTLPHLPRLENGCTVLPCRNGAPF
jgi:hypothetical protein